MDVQAFRKMFSRSFKRNVLMAPSSATINSTNFAPSFKDLLTRLTGAATAPDAYIYQWYKQSRKGLEYNLFSIAIV